MYQNNCKGTGNDLVGQITGEKSQGEERLRYTDSLVIVRGDYC